MSTSPLDKCLRLAERRQANWGAFPKTDPMVTDELTRQLDAAYAERRRSVARRRHGTTDAIVKRARVEREIERLASANGS